MLLIGFLVGWTLHLLVGAPAHSRLAKSKIEAQEARLAELSDDIEASEAEALRAALAASDRVPQRQIASIPSATQLNSSPTKSPSQVVLSKMSLGQLSSEEKEQLLNLLQSEKSAQISNEEEFNQDLARIEEEMRKDSTQKEYEAAQAKERQQQERFDALMSVYF